MNRWLLVLVIPLGLLALALLGVMVALVLLVSPPHVSAAALVILALVGVWFVLRRRGSSTLIAGSETSLIGRQSSTDGLL